MVDDAREIENLLYLYAERIDAGDFEGVADLFTHGRIAALPDAGPEQMVCGRDAVLALYEATTRRYDDDGTPHTRHLVTNVRVEIEPDAERATAHSVYTVLQQVDDGPLQPIVSGRYRDRFHRIDGSWCFETRTIFVDLVGDVSRHLRIVLPPSVRPAPRGGS